MGRRPSRSAAAFLDAHRAEGTAVLVAVLITLGFAVLSSPAGSVPDYLSQFNSRYDTRGTKLDSCQTCHTTPSGGADKLNPYGMDFGKNNHDFGAVEPLDSDGDGHSNIDEIKAETFPGDPQDFPGAQPPPPPPTTTTTTTAPKGPIPGVPVPKLPSRSSESGRGNRPPYGHIRMLERG